MDFKRGDTFVWNCQVVENNVAKDCTGWTVRSQIRNKRGFVEPLDFDWIDESVGTFELRKNDTTEWPIELLYCDIEYTTETGQIISTETTTITCLQDITV